MFASTAKILETADVLEKVAQLLECEELEEQQKKADAVKKEYIEPIKSVSDIPASLETKLASADPEVLNFIKSIADQKTSSSAYQSLGGPALEKNARDDSDDPLLAFMSGDD